MPAFINIPFAKPPVDGLRFASPEEPDAWNETLDVSDTTASAWCIQNAIWTTINNTKEDCLYLNVFTPSDAAYNSTSYQVMVWIHGGGFVAGSKDQYDPQHFLEHTEDLIIVVINYRLGIFGSLYDADYDTEVEGNFGFEDQMMAIDWVYTNIRYFGGDESNINLFGESAGGNSVALHLLYHHDHIASGIMQSPAVWVLHNEPDDNRAPTDEFSEAMDCDTAMTAAELLECWRAVNVSNVIEYWNRTAGTNLITAFAPTVGTELLPNHTMTAFAAEDLDIPPFVIGTTKNEAWFFLDDSLVGGQLDSFDGALGYASAAVQWHNLTVTAAVFEHYNITESHSLTANYIYDVMTIMTDVWICHVRSILDNLADTDNAWYYNLDVVNEDSNELFWGNAMSQCWNRTCHFVDIYYLFMNHAAAQQVDDDTVSLSQSMRNYWFNFAANHDPNMGVSVDVEWPGVSDSDNILVFDDEISTKSMVSDRVEICAFFDSIGYVAPFSMPDTETSTTSTTTDPDATAGKTESFGSGAMIFGIILAVLITAAFAVFVWLQFQKKRQLVSLDGQ